MSLNGADGVMLQGETGILRRVPTCAIWLVPQIIPMFNLGDRTRTEVVTCQHINQRAYRSP